MRQSGISRRNNSFTVRVVQKQTNPAYRGTAFLSIRYASRIHQGGNSAANVWPTVDKKASHTKIPDFYHTTPEDEGKASRGTPQWKNSARVMPVLCPGPGRGEVRIITHDLIPPSTLQAGCPILQMTKLARTKSLLWVPCQVAEPGPQVRRL